MIDSLVKKRSNDATVMVSPHFHLFRLSKIHTSAWPFSGLRTTYFSLKIWLPLVQGSTMPNLFYFIVVKDSCINV